MQAGLVGGIASDWQIADGITWAYEAGGGNADVLSNSWGTSTPSAAESLAITNADRYGRLGKGSLVVFAAGNAVPRTVPSWQSQLATVVQVGAIDRTGALTSYTATTAQIVAPSGYNFGGCNAGDVVTTDLMGQRGCNNGPNGNLNYTGAFSGTSASAPQVAGVGALLYAVSPSVTSAQARARLLAGADPWNNGNNDPSFGAGKLNALYTLFPLEVTVSGPTVIINAGTYTWSASASEMGATFISGSTATMADHPGMRWVLGNRRTGMSTVQRPTS